MSNGIFFINGLGWVTKTGPMSMSELRVYCFDADYFLPTIYWYHIQCLALVTSQRRFPPLVFLLTHCNCMHIDYMYLTYCHIVCLQIVLYEMLFCIRLQWHGLQFSAKYQLCDLCNAICTSNCPPCTPLYEAVLSRFCFHSCASTIHEFILLYWDSNSVRHNARWDCVKTIMLYDEFLSPSDHAVIVVFTARCYAERGIAMASCLSVRLSVRLSVCP